MQRNLMTHMGWMWMLTEGFRYRILLYVLLEIVGIGMGLVFVLWTKKVVDQTVAGGTDFFSGDLWIMIASLLGSVLARMAAGWFNERTKVEMLLSTQKQLLQKQLRATWQFLNRWSSGDLQVRIQDDAREVVQMAGQSIWSTGITLLSLLSFLMLLAWFDSVLALLMLAISLLFGFAKVYFKRTKRLNEQLKMARSDFGHVAQESLQSKLLIRALSIYPVRWKRIEDSLQNIADVQYSLISFTTFSHGMIRLLASIGFLVAFSWGLYRLHLGLITFGSLMAFLQLVGRIQTPVLSLMAFAPLAVRTRVATDRLMDMVDTEVEPEMENKVLNDLRAIYIDKLCFSYQDRPIIDNLSVTVYSGESVAIMGASGQGKTTFVRLILGMLSPTSGQIVLESKKESAVLTAAHRINMAYVPQGGKLFRGTVRDNLEVMEMGITESEIERALFLACAEFVYNLPDGLDTEIGEEGYGLSEGQAQRIAIARAMVRSSPVWLLDELTSALDEQTAKTVITRLLEEGHDKLILLVTHDLELAKRCDKIIYI
ncbi:ABC transporter ATP-binding protein [Sphingobacterium faecale]|uniref:ABC transporter ATP-binding protein n=1 Tax=Sphingobacterium faecale TaxID=2803775 RepID=A0ABS1QY97_9SPHI|nr:ABC transporter ATP-binding protein [Sphingobacterium faecale]MBL1407279.1 ABC transporter ATP-binding protein [Sphingobacterium faecale]